jgi:hypothetical protein
MRLLLALATAASPSLAAAQSRTRPAFPPQTAAHNGIITTEPYDEGDSTRRLITLQPMLFRQNPEWQASFSLTYSYTTNPYKFDGGVRLLFLSRGPQCRFGQNSPILITKANGVPFTVEYRPAPGYGVNWIYSETGEEGGCVESLTATLLPKTFTQLAEGNPRAARIGTANFLFDSNQVNAMRAFVRAVTRAPN